METTANSQTWQLPDRNGQPSDFHLLVASDEATRRRAYRLAHRLYQGEGLVVPANGEVTTPFDHLDETVVLLIMDGSGRDVATTTLTFDSAAGLPCDEDFSEVVAPWRARGTWLGEVTRLAVDRDVPGSRRLLDYLMQFSLIYSWYVRPVDTCVIQVGPYHSTFYERALGFSQIGPTTVCRRVQRISVLMHSDNLTCRRLLHADDCRRFHRPYFSETMEWRIAGFLQRNQRPVRYQPTDAAVHRCAEPLAPEACQRYAGVAAR